MKKTRILFRFPNDFGWSKHKVDLGDLKIISVFDTEVFAYIGNNCISIKRDSLPKNFLLPNKGE